MIMKRLRWHIRYSAKGVIIIINNNNNNNNNSKGVNELRTEVPRSNKQ